MDALSEDCLALEAGLRRAYQTVEPDPAFQEALYLRLMQTAAQPEAPVARSRAAGVVGALVGVAALSVAGAAVVLLRGRKGAPMYSAVLQSGFSALKGH